MKSLKFANLEFVIWNLEKNKSYNLEQRTFEFAKDVRLFVSGLKQTISNVEDGRQVVRSSGSVGANYIEANEGVSKKDFLHRVKISRKEAKESLFWLKLIEANNKFDATHEIYELIREVEEIRKILSAIINKSQ